AKTYQEKLLDEGFGRRSIQSLVELAERDDARGYALFHHERPVAVAFCRRYDDTLLYEWIGYDPGYNEFSPGTVLLLLMIEKLFVEQSFRFLDFGEGRVGTKSFFPIEKAYVCGSIFFRWGFSM